jgi:signal recognition particle subunit SRP14
LTTLLTSTHSQSHGSIYLTQKPLSSESDSSEATSPAQILIRATNGTSKPQKSYAAAKSKSKSANARPRIKFATVVDAGELESFYAKYAEVCKKGMEGLRKRDKKKAKAKAKKKGKGGGAVP